MTPHDAASHPTDVHRPTRVFRHILNWILDTDRRFRTTQSRINRFSNRF